MSSFKPKIAPATADGTGAAKKAPAAAVSDEAKQFKIKAGAVRRNIKDLAYARAEVERETKRLEKVAAEDPDKLKQQQGVIAEAQMMVPHADNRLRQSIQDLEALLGQHGPAIQAQVPAEDFEAAVASIAEAQAAIAAPQPQPAAQAQAEAKAE